MGESKNAVFLSYASQDAEAARRLCEALRSAGIEVWFDQSELRGGDAWDQKIRQQIRDCALFIPIVSTSTQMRSEGYFRLEWRIADQRTHLMGRNRAFLMPVCIDDTREADADIPDSFTAVQWTRLAGGDTPPTFVERVSRLLSPDPSHGPADVRSPASGLPHSATAPRQPAASPAASRQTPRVLLLIAAAAVIGLGYFAVDKFILSKRPAPSTASAPAVQSVAPAPSAIPEKSIAVLPFVDMSEKKDQEYFSDGLSEELIDHLAHSADLKVIARTSSFQFKGKNEDVRSIAEKLGVAHLLEGSVRTAGHDMRITAQLIRASDGTHLWSETYDRKMSDIFKVQDEIAEKVVQALNVTLSGSAAGAGGERNTEAYKLQLKGDFFYYRSNKGDLDRAIEQYRQALALDPNYALAWAKLGRTYFQNGQAGELKSGEAESKAREALQRALALDPNLVLAHRWLSRVYLQYDYDWSAAKKEIERAIALDPNGLEGKIAREDMLAWLAFSTGQFDEIIQLERQDLESNPLDANVLWVLGEMQYFAGRQQDALASRLRLLELAPTYSGAQADAGFSWLLLGKAAEALDAAEKETDELSKLQLLGCAYWAAGRKAESDTALRQLKGGFADRAAFSIAFVHSYRGEKDAAFEWLERAYRQHDPGMVAIKVEPLLSGLRGDPRFKALLRKMKLLE